MTVLLLVVMTLIVVAFVLLFALRSDLRGAFEEPKYRLLDQAGEAKRSP